MENVSIQYCFTLKDGSKEIYDLQLDAENLELQGNMPETPLRGRVWIIISVPTPP